MTENTSKARNPSKREWAEQLVTKLRDKINAGATPEEALESLTLRQYDFLIDYGVDLDHLILTPEQQQSVSELMKKQAGRQTFPDGYDKKYPKHKIDLYTALADFLIERGAEIIPRAKPNYRDLDFVLGDTRYKVVLSLPRA